MARRKFLRVLAGLVVVGVALVLVACVLKLSWDARFYADYFPDAPLHVVVRGAEDREAYRRIDFTFDGVPGHPVPTVLALPKEGPGPLPVVVFLHGIGQEKEFIDSIAGVFVEAGYALVCFDQSMQGERKLRGANVLEQALAFRRRAALTVLETRRLVDYLETRPDIAEDRIFLLGASYGAITGSTAAAFDTRLQGAVLCYGGGDIAKLVDSEAVREELGRGTGLLKWFMAWWIAPADPIRYVHKISPRPVLFQCGRYDTMVPPAASQALIDAAREPKDVIWYDSDHVGLDGDHVVTVLNDAIEWIEAHDTG